MPSQEKIEAKLQRTYGMSPLSKEEVQKFEATAEWYGTCRKCGKVRKGTREQVLTPCGCDDKHGE